MAKRKQTFLVKKGRMTAGEKSALANFYLTWGPHGAGLTKRRAQVDREFPYTNRDVDRLLARGLMSISAPEWPDTVIDITPQGTAVARMILGLTKRRKHR